MSKLLSIDEDYLAELIKYTSKSLVGKLLKRFEILHDNNMIKADSKELIYEEFRQLRDLIKAHNTGLNISIFNFKKKQEDQPTQ